MKFQRLDKKTLEALKISDGFELHPDCLFLIVEAPSRRSYTTEIQNKDRRYLAGIIFTYPIELQKAMWEPVIKNFVLSHERKRWISDIESWLKQTEFGDNILDNSS